jgi:hypothetical protein
VVDIKRRVDNKEVYNYFFISLNSSFSPFDFSANKSCASRVMLDTDCDAILKCVK